MNGRSIKYKIDTGAAVTALPATMLKDSGGEIKPTNKIHKAAGNQQLCVQGISEVTSELEGRKVKDTLYIV